VEPDDGNDVAVLAGVADAVGEHDAAVAVHLADEA
jgi:hypothetical protein